VTNHAAKRLLCPVAHDRSPGDELFRAWVRDGDLRRAGNWLVRSFADDVLSVCVAMARSRAPAEDLAQDVFGRALTQMREFRGDSSVRTWVLAIARNRCIDYLRQSRRDPWAGAPADGEGEPDGHADDAPLAAELLLRRHDVSHALSALSEGERALVILRFKNGLEYDELAAAFGLREGTVRMRISRALERMRDALTESTADEFAPMPSKALSPQRLTSTGALGRLPVPRSVPGGVPPSKPAVAPPLPPIPSAAAPSAPAARAAGPAFGSMQRSRDASPLQGGITPMQDASFGDVIAQSEMLDSAALIGRLAATVAALG